MLVEHTLTMSAQCPNGCRDLYEVTFRVGKLVMVEELLEVVAQYEEREIFQEELTQQLADLLQCEVESQGTHSDVRTRVVCRYEDTRKCDGEAG
jgi:GTP cyclohydrolase I